MDRVSGYEPAGREFESPRARQIAVNFCSSSRFCIIISVLLYYKFKSVWNEYSRIKNKPSFREKRQAELMIFESARKALREHYGERKWDSLKELQAERGKLTAEQDRLYAENRKS